MIYSFESTSTGNSRKENLMIKVSIFIAYYNYDQNLWNTCSIVSIQNDNLGNIKLHIK